MKEYLRMLTKTAAVLAIVAGLLVSPGMTASAQDCWGAASCDTECCDTGCCGPSCWDRIADRFDCSGLIKPSDRCFDDFISPMINFAYFEDPRTLTELRPIFITHQWPDTVGNGIAAGGSVQLMAAQFRLALSERLSLIVVKGGYIINSVNGDVGANTNSGWTDVSAGLKYNLVRDTCRGRLVSVGANYEIPIGSDGAAQGLADGEFHLFTTAGQRLFDGNAHLLTSVGYRFPVDGDALPSSIHWSNHFDVRLTDNIYAVTEATWWHWTDNAEDGFPSGIGGQDLFDAQSSDVAGNDLVTQNLGLKIKPRRNVEAGIAYEFPLSGFQDVIEDRLQFDLILRY